MSGEATTAPVPLDAAAAPSGANAQVTQLAVRGAVAGTGPGTPWSGATGAGIIRVRGVRPQ
ncbi:hypothetical protein ABT336_14690 [Micromonospora sp. NPDC000207]|uniref:hypothetical protein n=1 Tax=Micromonospora sp. NPDC000207 TaxID=3154246 RepID=UPI00331CB961